MALTYVKYNCFVEDVENKLHDLVGTAGAGADTLKGILSNTAPNVATHLVRADVTELGTANGYTAGGVTCQNVGSRSGGTLTVTATGWVWTASGGAIGPFRYLIIYNSTAAGGPLVCYFDYGSSITLNDTETATVTFGANLFTHT